jgi:hypothetical protein
MRLSFRLFCRSDPSVPPFSFRVLCLLAGFFSVLPALFYLAAEDFGAGRPYIFADAACFSCAVHHAFDLGVNPYDPAVQKACAGAAGRLATPFFYPPWSLFPLAVLYPVHDAAAGFVMLAFNLVAWLFVTTALVSWYLSARNIPPVVLAVLGIWLCFSQMATGNLVYGQVNLPALALLAWFVLAALRGRDSLSALCLAAAILLKSHFAAFLVLPLMTGRWRLLSVTTGLLAGAAVSAGWPLWREWLALARTFATPDMGGLLSPDLVLRGNLSLGGLALRFGWPQELVHLAKAVVLGVTLAAIWRLRRRPEDFWRGGFALLMLALYLVSPLTWVSHAAFLLPAVLELALLLVRVLPSGMRLLAVFPSLAIAMPHDLYPALGGMQAWLPTAMVFAGWILLLRLETAEVSAIPGSDRTTP